MRAEVPLGRNEPAQPEKEKRAARVSKRRDDIVSDREAKHISAVATIVDTRASSAISEAQLPSDSLAPSITEIESPPPGQTRRLRIAIVSPKVGTGAGVPHYWQALATVLAQDHEVHVFTAQANRESLEGIVVHKVRAPLLGWFLLHVGFYVAVRYAVRPGSPAPPAKLRPYPRHRCPYAVRGCGDSALCSGPRA